VTSAAEALAAATRVLAAAGCATPRLDAEVLLAHSLGVSRGDLLTADLSAPDAFAELVERRREREPVAYITGIKGFRHIELQVDERVLVPRPETEHLVEAALELPQGAGVVDVGTGSGAVALALAHERPDLRVTGTDVSEEALAVARANGERLGLEVEWVVGDLLVPSGVDAVVSNPPYVRDDEVLPPEVMHEPSLALRAGPDGLDVYRQLIPRLRGTFVALEVGAGQAEAVAGLLEGWQTELRPDLAGIDRVVVGRR
jgi:release factor glutamine methyltransferase